MQIQNGVELPLRPRTEICLPHPALRHRGIKQQILDLLLAQFQLRPRGAERVVGPAVEGALDGRRLPPRLLHLVHLHPFQMALGVRRDGEPVGQHHVLAELPALEEAGAAADVGDEVHRRQAVPFAVRPPALPVVQAQDRVPAFVQAGEILVDVDLVQGAERGQFCLRVPVDAFAEPDVAGGGVGALLAVVVLGIYGFGKGEREEDTGAPEGHQTVMRDRPPIFGQCADVVRLGSVER